MFWWNFEYGVFGVFLSDPKFWRLLKKDCRPDDRFLGIIGRKFAPLRLVGIVDGGPDGLSLFINVLSGSDFERLRIVVFVSTSDDAVVGVDAHVSHMSRGVPGNRVASVGWFVGDA